jgi:hypothetical protein
MWFAVCHILCEGSNQVFTFGLTQANLNANAGVAESLNAATCHLGVGVNTANNDMFDARVDDGISTGRRLSSMATWFQRHNESRVIWNGRTCAQGLDFSMWTTKLTVPAFTNDSPILDDDATDTWIGTYVPRTPSRKGYRVLHRLLEGYRGGH